MRKTHQLLTLFISLLFMTHLINAQSIVSSVEKDYSGIHTIIINGYYSRVEVMGTSTSQTILKANISSSLHPYLNIHHKSENGTLTITVDTPKSNPDNTKGLIRLSVPSRTNIAVKNTNGQVLLQNLTGTKQSINTTLGKIHLENISATVDIKTVSGDVTVAGLKGQLELSAQLGNHILRRCSGEASINTGRGHVTVSDFNGPLKIQTSSGRQTIKMMNGNIDLTSKEGDLTINNIKGHINAESTSGQVNIEQASGTISINTVAGSQTGKSVRLTGNSTFTSLSGNIYFQLINPKSELSFLMKSKSGILKAYSNTVKRSLALGSGPIKINSQTASGNQTFY
ncbi:DUF4097 family beta strand repeat protein [Carboxylicivirga sp. A043]|uniref:DUF4097 family beta strand repeat-containing protein n=1 Tax=Carboxylicivirga litoralis TaxID=2816963 RepID=UPI0021CB5820|nr:DUF4097 family beta strand repeat-containing protein [Carboxylicivirga sp. A043]MCU4156217.1 DUF4097 family beta strand repeat protein [Carboxylicivirga sp. A043]